MQKTPLGYPTLSEDLHERVFAGERIQEMSPQQKRKIIANLKRFGVSVPVDYPENLYSGPLPLGNLKGKNLREHFETVATEQIGKYKEMADRFATCTLPKVPPVHELLLEPGWVRYEQVGDKWKIEHVDIPLESAFTFDTETFVYKGAYPIIGTAMSEKAAYLWLAAELINPKLPEDEWDEWDMIPIGTDRFVVGHNISYDRVRTREAYTLSRTAPENFYFDTLSAHVGVSGLAAGQRSMYLLSKKDPEALSFSEQRMLKFGPDWLDKGSTNNMVSTYNLHVAEPRDLLGGECTKLSETDKETRNIFVVAQDLGQIRNGIANVLVYALNDAFYTAELFQALWPKYRDSTPSMTALCGHYHLNGSIVPLIPHWDEWIDNVEKVYEQFNNEVNEICHALVFKYFEEWKNSNDPAAYVAQDPWLKQLNWEVETVKGKYAHIPKWMRPFIKDPNEHIGVKSKLAHKLLKLKWEGSPMILTKDQGWCWTNSEGELVKIPHPKGTGENVGGVLSKDFVDDMAVGRLSSDLQEAKRALEIANAVSYWTSVRKRVMSRIVKEADNPYGDDALVTAPEILCHGTVTRRTVESLMVTMCSTKNFRVGTELKTRVQAPDGWKIVGADFDGQEMQVASIYADSWEGGQIGCSPFGYNVLSGSKEAGTDPHSALAKLAGVDRDTAKIAGFAVLYGAGGRAIQTYIRRKYPEKSEKEVKKFADRILSVKKGMLNQDGHYEGGTDSGCFNYMEEIAMRSRVATLPCLGTKISTALRKNVVGNDFKTGRVNWTIQSSGAEILSIFLTAIHWLSAEYKIPSRFIISIHDEIWFMTPERYAEQFAVLFQMAHMYTWALFHSAVGMPELPLSRAFFSSVAIDNRIRKSPKEKTVTPSHPEGINEPFGAEYSMTELAQIGAVKKLTTRYQAIKNGLIQ